MQLRITLGSIVLCSGLAMEAHAAPNDFCSPQVSYPVQDWHEVDSRFWTGASQFVGPPLVAAAGEITSVRSVWDAETRRVFLYWTVRGDPQINPAYDAVALGLTDASGTPFLYYQVHPFQSCGTTLGSVITDIGQLGSCATGRDVDPSTQRYATPMTTSAWGPLSTTNPVASHGSFPIVFEEPWVRVVDAGDTFDWEFKVAVRLPVAPGTGQVDPAVRLYGTALVAFRRTPEWHVMQHPVLCEAPVPETCGDHDLGPSPGPTSVVPLAPSWWMSVRTGNHPQCDGIELMRELVGSTHEIRDGVISGTNVVYPLPSSTVVIGEPTQLRAGFRNGMADIIHLGTVRAVFRMHTFGAHDSFANWLGIAENVPLLGEVEPGSYAGLPGQGMLQTPSWTPPGPTPPRPFRRAVAVFLRGQPHPGSKLVFRNDTVVKMMDFTTASVVRQPAEVSLLSRRLTDGQEAHSVVLLARHDRMPSVEACRESQGLAAGCQPVERGKDGAVALDDLARYTVHAFVDTGRRLELQEGEPARLLVPFASYGYHVYHEGELEGWEQGLRGAAPMDGIPSLYEVEVPPGHIVTLVDTIRAIDEETRPCAEANATSQRPRAPEPNRLVPGSQAGLSGVEVARASLGCDEVPIRPPCRADACPPVDPVVFIEASELTHVGQGTGQEPPEDRPPCPQTTCCVRDAETRTPGEAVRGSAGASAMGLLLLGLRRRRRRRSHRSRTRG